MTGVAPEIKETHAADASSRRRRLAEARDSSGIGSVLARMALERFARSAALFVPLSADQKSMSQGENGAVNGDSVRTISQAAENVLNAAAIVRIVFHPV